MICPKCQTTNSEGYAFCINCGESISDSPIGEKTERLVYTPNLSNATVSSVTSDNLSGNTLDGKYQLEAKIGEGGMGVVYVATRLHIGDKVAVKVLHSDKMSDPTAGERFRREVQMAAQLKHPNVVSIYDYGMTQNGLHYIVMELVEGKTLRQLIAKQGVLPLPVISTITSQVCAALDEAHRQGLIHRDIKPDNISVQETPDGLRVKVLDFGIAKLQESSSNLTQTDTIVGTPKYMSPEQCSGEAVSGSSDIYSFGVVLYEMVCGVVPFNAPSSTAVAVQQVTKLPTPPRQINKTVSLELEMVVLHALEKEAENRPTSATALAQELNNAIQGGQAIQADFIQNSGENLSTATIASVPTSESSQQETVSFAQIPKESTPSSPVFLSKQTKEKPDSTKKSKIPLLVGVLAVAFVLILGMGGFALWLFMPSGNSSGNKNVLDNKSAKIIENDRNPSSSPAFSEDNSASENNFADDELTKLNNERLSSSSNQMDELEAKLKKAEEKYPNDYRFTYQRAKLFAPLRNNHHKKSFSALFEAVSKAIKNNQASQMLSEITRDTNSDFRRMADGQHGEWTAIIEALQEKDESLLSEEKHDH